MCSGSLHGAAARGRTRRVATNRGRPRRCLSRSQQLERYGKGVCKLSQTDRSPERLGAKSPILCRVISGWAAIHKIISHAPRRVSDASPSARDLVEMSRRTSSRKDPAPTLGITEASFETYCCLSQSCCEALLEVGQYQGLIVSLRSACFNRLVDLDRGEELQMARPRSQDERACRL